MAASGQALGFGRAMGRSTSSLISASIASTLAPSLPCSAASAAQTGDRAARFPLFHVFARAIRIIAHPFGVRAGAIGEALNQGRAAAATGPFDGLGRGVVHGQHVVAINRNAGQTVAFGPRGDGRIAGRISEGNFGGKLIVFADEQHRQLPDRGHVQPLVKGAVVHRPVAEKRDRDVVGLVQPKAIARAGGLQDAGANDAAGAHHSHLGREQMHAAAAAARAAGGTTVQLGDQLQRRHALGQSVAVAAMRAENHILMPQMGAHAGRDRFLPDVGMAGAVDQPALMRADQQLLAAADKRHRPVQGEQAIGGDSRIGFDGHRLGRS